MTHLAQKPHKAQATVGKPRQRKNAAHIPDEPDPHVRSNHTAKPCSRANAKIIEPRVYRHGYRARTLWRALDDSGVE